METLAELGIKITPKGIREAAREMDRLADKAEDAERAKKGLEGRSMKTSAAIGKLTKRFQNVLGPMKAVAGLAGIIGFSALAAGALAAATTLGGLAASSVRVSDQFFQMKQQLSALRGGVAQAESDFIWIRSFAKNTPLELADVTGEFKTLVAYGLEPTSGIMGDLVDISSSLGGGIETTSAIVRGFGKAWAKGKLQGEEALQLLERGIPVWETLGTVLGVTSQEAQQLSEKGLLGRDAIKALMLELGSQRAGAAEAMMKTLQGRFTSLQDTASTALALIGDQITDDLMRLLERADGVLGDLIDAGYFEAIGKGFETVIVKAEAWTDALSVTAKQVANLYQSIEPILTWNSSDANGFGKFVVLVEKLALVELGKINRDLLFLSHLMEKGWKGEGFFKALSDYRRDLRDLYDIDEQSAFFAAIKDGWSAANDFLDDIVAKEEARIAAEEARAAIELKGIEKAAAKRQEEWDRFVGKLVGGSNRYSRAISRTHETVFDRQVVEAFYRDAEAYAGRYNQSILAYDADRRDTVMGHAHDIESEVNRALKGGITPTEYQQWVTSLATVIQGTLGDTLYLVFTGQFDRLGEAFQSFFDGLSSYAADSLSAGIADAMKAHAGGSQNAFREFFRSDEFKEYAGTLVGGLIQNYGVQQAQQGNRTAGVLLGAAGGALQGAMLGFSSSGFNPVGAIVGAVVGGLTSWLGSSGEKEPHIRAQYVEGYGFDVYGAGDQQFSEESRAVWEQNMNAAMATELKGYRDTLMTLALATEDLSLLDLDTALGSIDFEKLEGTPDEIARWITDVWLPDQLDAIFGPKFQDGLEQLGLNTTAIGEIMAEIARLPVAQRLESLNTIITALASAQELMTGLTRDGIMADVGKDPFTAMTEMMDAAALQATVLSSNLDDMSPLEQAQRLQEINTLVANVRQAEIQYLQQLDSMQKAMNASIDAQIEDLRLGGMSDQQQAQYHADRILELWGQISSGDLTASQMTEAIAELQSRVGELQPFLAGAYSGIDLLGNETSGLDIRMLDLFGGIFGDNTAADWFGGLLGDLGLTGDVTGRNFLIELLDRARDLGNTTIDSERDAIIDKNQEYIDAIQGVIDAMNTLSGTVDDVFPGNGSGSGPDGPFNDDVPPMPGKAGGVTGDATHEYAMAAAAEQQTILLERLNEKMEKQTEVLSEISAKADRPLIAQAHVNTSAGGLEAIIQSVVISMFTPPEELQ